MEKLTNLNEAVEGSYYTITGAGGDVNEWVNGYNGMLKEAKIGTPKKWYTFTGKDMNETYSLRGTTEYPEDLTFLAFPLDGLNVGKLAMFKIKNDDRWFDDIVNNNAHKNA